MNAYKRTRATGLVLVLIMLLVVGLMPAAAQGEIETLTETVESPNGMLTINYPEGWALDLSLPSAIRLGTNQAMLDADGTVVPLPAGEFQVIALEGDTMLNMMAPGWEDATSLDEAIDLVLTHVLAEGTTVTSRETTILAGYPAQIIITLQPDREGLVGVIDFEGNYVLVGVNSQIGEYAEHADLGWAILDTLRYAGLESSPADTLPLTETYTLDSGYSFGFPQDWATAYEMNEPDLSLIALGSNDTIVQKGGFNYDFAPGDVWVDFHWEALSNFSGDLDADSSPVDVLNSSIVGLYPNMSDAVEMQLDGHTIALTEGVHESGKPVMGVFFFWDDNTICWFIALTAPGEYEQARPTLLAIAESALPDDQQTNTLTDTEPPPLTQVQTVENGYSFAYPDGWVTASEYTDVTYAEIVLGNKEIATQGWFGEPVAAGNVRINFSWGALDELTSNLSPDASAIDVFNAQLGGVYPDMGAPYEMQLGDAVVAVAEGTDFAENAMLVVVFPWQDDIWGVMYALTTPDEYEQAKPTLLAIAESALPGMTEAASQPNTATDADPGSTTPNLGALVDSLNDPSTESATATVPTSINGPADCYNVAASINDFSSEFGGADYAPVNLLDNNPATGWSSAGGVEVEYVEINLDRSQTIYGILFNSYPPSPRYETDSIKDFAVEATLSDGSTRAILKGQAALAQGYQSYLFDPVETNRVRFIFNSTHGGSYYEAADIMVCALEGSASSETIEHRQWAARAQATSQYSSTDWSAQQATGAPDTAGCSDVATAWASSAADGVDTLTVFFDTPVIPTQISIHQNYNPGAIMGVELIPAESGPVIPIPNSADPNTGCPGVFTLDVPADLIDGGLVSGVAIRLDQRNHTGWNEIDAVELVGEVDPSAITANEADANLSPLPAAVACNVQARRRVNMRGGPGTNYNVAGQLRWGALMPANGQTTGQDGYTWWRLTYGGWVRGDVVEAAANCSSTLPRVSADDPLPLTQRYVTPDGFAFDYPQDWVIIEEPGGATIGNSWEAAQNPFGEQYYTGEFQASIRWMTIDGLAPDTGLATGATPMQVLRAAISVSSGLDMAEPYELQIGNQVVAAAYGTFYDDNVEIAIVIFEAKDGLYGSVLTGSDLRGLEQFEPTLRAIIASALNGSR